MDRRLIKQIAETIRQADRHKTHAYDTAATVVRVEGGTAWVHIPGGVDETPVKLTVDAKQGDTVQVRVSGGRAFLVGNATAPPTDDTTANKVGTSLTATQKVVKAVKATADKAVRIATSTAQYFWVSTGGTDNGAHVTAIPQEEFEADPQNGGGNTLMTSNGVAVRDGLTELATFSNNRIAFSDEDGERVHMEMQSEYYEIGSNDGVYLRSSDVEDAGTQNLAGQTSGLDSYFKRGTAVREASVTAQAVDDPTSSTHAESVTLEVESNESGTPKIGKVKLMETGGATSLNVTVDEMLVGNTAPIVKDTFSDLNKSANTYYYQKTFNVAKSGYTPIAFNPYTNHATEAACMVNYNSLAGDATVTVMSRNGTISGLNLYLDVAYARNELL